MLRGRSAAGGFHAGDGVDLRIELGIAAEAVGGDDVGLETVAASG
jgi:hypothetical protein